MNNKDAVSARQLRSAYEGQKATPFDFEAVVSVPLELHRCTVQQGWVDYNQHMSESCYLLVFGDSSDAFFRYLGIDDDYRSGGHSIYTIETHIRYLREATLGEPLRLTLRLLDVDHKRLHIFHEMYHAGSGALLANAEQLLMHVDMQAGQAAPFSPGLLARLNVIHSAHSQDSRPVDKRRVIGINRRTPT
ncbi:thioesterase family protein [Caballeronia sordidicola]|uniref:3-hydroxyacyl-CoA dehydrogenase n=1 Tax=Caballeronia sordidicola TaxID=196367 RepID=A0A226X8F5_CABSO|nr:thioesterase family protein [Caballeronia sordidicola]OXC79765.1 3-hydroxyacyl-CoA dehydrogenase [Caballeronia sordidicola]